MGHSEATLSLKRLNKLPGSAQLTPISRLAVSSAPGTQASAENFEAPPATEAIASILTPKSCASAKGDKSKATCPAIPGQWGPNSYQVAGYVEKDGKRHYVGAPISKDDGRPVLFEESVATLACNDGDARAAHPDLEEGCKRNLSVEEPAACAYAAQSNACAALDEPAFLVSLVEIKMAHLAALFDANKKRSRTSGVLGNITPRSFTATRLREALGVQEARMPLELCSTQRAEVERRFLNSVLEAELTKLGHDGPDQLARQLNDAKRLHSAILKEVALSAGCLDAGKVLKDSGFLRKLDSHFPGRDEATTSALSKALSEDIHQRFATERELKQQALDECTHRDKCDQDVWPQIAFDYAPTMCVFYRKDGTVLYEDTEDPNCNRTELERKFAADVAECRMKVKNSYGFFRKEIHDQARELGVGTAAYRSQFWCSPLVLDLDGDGQVTQPGKTVSFDINADGKADTLDWIDTGDALVIRDQDGTGCAESGAELFGDSTPLVGGQRAANGFQALAGFDTNGDSQVDLGEASRAGIRLWRDNGDAVCHRDEVYALEALGVTALGVHYESSKHMDAGQNKLLYQGSFRDIAGMRGKLIDVFFKTELGR